MRVEPAERWLMYLHTHEALVGYSDSYGKLHDATTGDKLEPTHVAALRLPHQKWRRGERWEMQWIAR